MDTNHSLTANRSSPNYDVIRWYLPWCSGYHVPMVPLEGNFTDPDSSPYQFFFHIMLSNVFVILTMYHTGYRFTAMFYRRGLCFQFYRQLTRSLMT